MKLQVTERVAIVSPTLGVGGAEMQAIHVANGFARGGIEVVLIVLKRDMAIQEWLDPEVSVVRVGARTGLRSVGRLRRILSRFNADAVIAFQEHAILPALLAVNSGRRSAAPVIGAIQNVVTPKLKSSDVTWKSHLMARLLPKMAARCAAVIALSGDVASDLESNWFGRGRDVRLFVIPNAVELAAMRPEDRAEHTSAYYVAVGRLIEQKGYDRMFAAYQRYLRCGGTADLVVLGEGRLRTELEARLVALGIAGHVRMPGVVADVQPIVSGARALLLTSYWEGFGNVMIEAMACATPVVAYRCPGGPATIVRDGENGFLIEDGHERAFVQALQRLDDPSITSRELSDNALRSAQAYGVEVVAARYRDVVETVTS